MMDANDGALVNNLWAKFQEYALKKSIDSTCVMPSVYLPNSMTSKGQSIFLQV